MKPGRGCIAGRGDCADGRRPQPYSRQIKSTKRGIALRFDEWATLSLWRFRLVLLITQLSDVLYADEGVVNLATLNLHLKITFQPFSIVENN